MMALIRRLSLLAILLFVLGCKRSYESVAIDIGNDNCDYCRMTIVNARYGGELISNTGKYFKFDSLECMRHFQSENEGPFPGKYLVDFSRPGNFLPAETATIVRTPERAGPMGSPLVAFSSIQQAQSALRTESLQSLSWNDLVSQNANASEK